MGWDEMLVELDFVLEYMKIIFMNLLFVLIEEVMLWEEEIVCFKDGWVKMEDWWKDVVLFIDIWWKCMVVSGKFVDEDEMMMSLWLSFVKIWYDIDVVYYVDFGLLVVVEENEEEFMM